MPVVHQSYLNRRTFLGRNFRGTNSQLARPKTVNFEDFTFAVGSFFVSFLEFIFVAELKLHYGKYLWTSLYKRHLFSSKLSYHFGHMKAYLYNNVTKTWFYLAFLVLHVQLLGHNSNTHKKNWEKNFFFNFLRAMVRCSPCALKLNLGVKLVSKVKKKRNF